MKKKLLIALILVGGLAMISIPFAAVGLRHYAWEPFVTTSESMMPTILPGDRFYVRKSFGPSEITRGTLVTYKNPKDPSVIFVKRVVAIAGDTITIANNMLFINSKQVEQKPSETLENSHLMQEQLDKKRYNILIDHEVTLPSDLSTPYVVPAATVFVLGDNRTNSFDSRHHGAVEVSEIVGIPSIIWFSASSDRIRWERLFKELL